MTNRTTNVSKATFKKAEPVQNTLKEPLNWETLLLKSWKSIQQYEVKGPMDELRQKQVLNRLAVLQEKNKTVMEVKLEQKQHFIDEVKQDDLKPIRQGVGWKKIESSPFTDQKKEIPQPEVSPMKEEIPQVTELPKDL